VLHLSLLSEHYAVYLSDPSFISPFIFFPARSPSLLFSENARRFRRLFVIRRRVRLSERRAIDAR